MKSINVYFETGEYNALKKKKGGMSWRKFILQLIEKDSE